MSSRMAYVPLILTFLLFITRHTVMGKMECEELPVEACAFSVSSSGARCVLETLLAQDGSLHYLCQSSNVMAENYVEWIETEDCMNACGMERMSVGLSTDSLVESSHLTQMLCSSECRNNCPNIFHLYTNLAAGEGVSLPQFCDAHKFKSRKLIIEGIWAFISANTLNAWTASAPSSSFPSQNLAAAPASAPSLEP